MVIIFLFLYNSVLCKSYNIILKIIIPSCGRLHCALL